MLLEQDCPRKDKSKDDKDRDRNRDKIEIEIVLAQILRNIKAMLLGIALYHTPEE